MEEMTPTPPVETPAAGQEPPSAAPVHETPVTATADAEGDAPSPPTPEPASPAETQQSDPTYGMPGEDALEPDGGMPLATAAVVVVVVVLAALTVLGLRRRNGAGRPANGEQEANGNRGGSNDNVVEIYVGNLSYDMTEAHFRKEFERFGVVKSARIIGHRTSGKSKGYGFVEMPHRKEAMVAIKALHNRDVLGRKLRVNEARKGTRKD